MYSSSFKLLRANIFISDYVYGKLFFQYQKSHCLTLIFAVRKIEKLLAAIIQCQKFPAMLLS
jgi:hypothetical protein